MSARAAIIIGNLLTPLGVLLFGWSVAAAVFLIWLDIIFVSVQLGVLIFAAGSHALAPPAGTSHTTAWWIGVAIGAGLMAPLFIAPPLVFGAQLLDLLAPQSPDGPFAAIFAGRVIILWVAIQVLLRGWQVVSRAGELRRDASAAASFVPQAAYQFLALAYRLLLLLALIWVSSLFGRHGALVFLFVGTALMTYFELHENWLPDIAAKLRALEEELREKGRARRAERDGRL
jgi:hypothetical protein